MHLHENGISYSPKNDVRDRIYLIVSSSLQERIKKWENIVVWKNQNQKFGL